LNLISSEYLESIDPLDLNLIFALLNEFREEEEEESEDEHEKESEVLPSSSLNNDENSEEKIDDKNKDGEIKDEEEGNLSHPILGNLWNQVP
jgi:hypothetical protein